MVQWGLGVYIYIYKHINKYSYKALLAPLFLELAGLLKAFLPVVKENRAGSGRRAKHYGTEKRVWATLYPRGRGTKDLLAPLFQFALQQASQ